MAWPEGLSRRLRGLAVGKRARAGRRGDGAEENRVACHDQGEREVHMEKRQEDEEGRGMGEGDDEEEVAREEEEEKEEEEEEEEEKEEEADCL